MINRHTSLIANCISISEPLPFNIGNDVVLRKANSFELSRIREVLLTRTGRPEQVSAIYEMNAEPNGINSVSFKKIEKQDDFHYYVLSDDDWGNRVREIEDTLLLIDSPLELSAAIDYHLENMESAPIHAALGLPPPYIIERYYYDLGYPRERPPITTKDFLKAEKIRKELKSLPKEFDFIKNAIANWKELRKVSRRSNLCVVGLFSIIEMLLTHPPRLAESLDSITSQLKGKLRLITNHIGCSDLLKQHFGELSTENAWKKLYQYRSDIAHGNPIAFQSSYIALKSHQNIVDFLITITRTLLRRSIAEHQLFLDLKAC